MSEDAFRPKPVVDPALPAGLRERIIHDWSPPLDPEGEPVTRRFRIREGGLQVLAVGLPLLLATLLSGRHLAMVIVGISLAAYTVALVCRRDVTPATRAMGVVAGAGTAVAVSLWALDHATVTVWSPWLVFGVMVAMIITDSLTSCVYEPADLQHVVLPADVSVIHHPLLLEVQHTIDRAVETGEELNGGLDTDRALVVLRDQEWRIARLLAGRRTLRRTHLRRWQQAVSPRLRKALEPQRRQLGEMEEVISTRVGQIIEYRALLDRAVKAHRESRQCEEPTDTTFAHIHQLAPGAALAFSGTEIDDPVASTGAVSRARGAQVRPLVDTPLPSNS